jgi:hypothetical protein
LSDPIWSGPKKEYYNMIIIEYTNRTTGNGWEVNFKVKATYFRLLVVVSGRFGWMLTQHKYDVGGQVGDSWECVSQVKRSFVECQK